jgi:hypothetical protein
MWLSRGVPWLCVYTHAHTYTHTHNNTYIERARARERDSYKWLSIGEPWLHLVFPNEQHEQVGGVTKTKLVDSCCKQNLFTAVNKLPKKKPPIRGRETKLFCSQLVDC